jgi:hypothetical protein
VRRAVEKAKGNKPEKVKVRIESKDIESALMEVSSQ